jgi:hypothetical protein
MVIPVLREKKGEYLLSKGYSEWFIENIKYGFQLTKSLSPQAITVLIVPIKKDRAFVTVCFSDVNEPTFSVNIHTNKKRALKVINEEIKEYFQK